MLAALEADGRKQLARSLIGLGLRHLRELEREAHVAERVALHQEVEALENHADIPPGVAELAALERGHILPVDDDAAAGRRLEQVDAAHQRALARAGEADDTEDLALLDAERHIVERVDGGLAGAEGLGKML